MGKGCQTCRGEEERLNTVGVKELWVHVQLCRARLAWVEAAAPMGGEQQQALC